MPDATTQVKLPQVSEHTPSYIVTRRLILMFIVDNAKIFKEELLKKNTKNSNTLNLQTLRLGINSIIALSNGI